MKTVAQWAEQLPELIKIEFLKVNNKMIYENFKYLYNAIKLTNCPRSKFWCGVYENALIDPTSADYIDETIPYTKEEVEAMILEFADPNDEVCKVMLWNIAKPKEVTTEQLYKANNNEADKWFKPEFYSPINGDLKDNTQNEPCYLFQMREGENLQQFSKRIEQENEALKSTIYRLEKENAALISTTQGLNAIVETQKAEIAELKTRMDELNQQFYPLNRELNSANALIKSYRIDNGNKVNEIEQLTRELKATQEAFTKKTKTETNHKPSLSQRFLNWILS